jgi:prepilin-type N-terminal cleavage/methylation domain-containing protein
MIMTKDGALSIGNEPRGFTAVEVLIVIAILMALAAVAIPNLSGWASKQRLKSVARDLFTHFQYARLEAVKRSSNTALRFNPDVGNSPGSYLIFVDNGAGPGGNAGNRLQDGTEETLKYVVFPTDVNLDSTTFAANAAGFGACGFNARGFPIDSSFIGEEGVVRVSNDEGIYEVKLRKTSGGLKLERLL